MPRDKMQNKIAKMRRTHPRLLLFLQADAAGEQKASLQQLRLIMAKIQLLDKALRYPFITLISSTAIDPLFRK